jgi:tRNA G18 (ribose-2'-O)-methylase SpoU
VAATLRERGLRLRAAAQNGSTDYDRVDWSGPSALILGSEGAGFSAEDLRNVYESIRIPMAGAVESLNVGSAAAICLFEAARQRRAVAGKPS